MITNEKLLLMSAWLAKAQLEKVTSVQPSRKVNVDDGG